MRLLSHRGVFGLPLVPRHPAFLRAFALSLSDLQSSITTRGSNLSSYVCSVISGSSAFITQASGTISSPYVCSVIVESSAFHYYPGIQHISMHLLSYCQIFGLPLYPDIQHFSMCFLYHNRIFGLPLVPRLPAHPCVGSDIIGPLAFQQYPGIQHIPTRLPSHYRIFGLPLVPRHLAHLRDLLSHCRIFCLPLVPWHPAHLRPFGQSLSVLGPSISTQASSTSPCVCSVIIGSSAFH